MRTRTKVVVVGGGFAGVTAARRLARRRGFAVTLLDPKPAFEMLTILPDIVGGRLSTGCAGTPHRKIAARCGYRFVQEAAVEIDRNARRVTVDSGAVFAYDFLLLAHGGRAAFYHNRSAERYARPLRCLADALEIRKRALRREHRTLLVVGGGYTGVELAGQLHRLRFGAGGEPGPPAQTTRIIIVEAAEELLGMQEPWMRRWADAYLRRLGVEILPGTTVDTVEPDAALLSDGTRFSDAVSFWTAGIRIVTPQGAVPDSPAGGGRLPVDEYLHLGGGVFVAGDAAAFSHRGALLPPASYIAVQQGARAARNIARAAAGRPLLPYRPLVHGFVIPVAGGTGFGRLHGIPLTGRPVAAVHYAAAAARSQSPAQRNAILREALRGGPRDPRPRPARGRA